MFPFQNRLKRIDQFLEDYASLYQVEPLEFYPNSYSYKVQEIIDLFTSLDQKLQLDFLNLRPSKNYPEKLQNYLNELIDLIQVPYFTTNQVSILKLKKVSYKKCHEVNRIYKYLKNNSPQSIVEFCSGMGHLGHYLKDQFSCDVQSLEIDPILIKKGQELYPVHHFIEKDILTLKNLEFTHSKKSCALALHCCGDLTDNIIKLYNDNLNFQELLSFGCCYHKLTTHFDGLSNHALTLATRSYAHTTQKDMRERFQVKKYRYALELYLREKETNISINLRSSRAHVYQKNFLYYLEQIETKLPLKISNIEAVKFFNKAEVQSIIKNLFFAGLFRGTLGRLVELKLNLLRAIPLIGQHHIEIGELFDPSISQRNIFLHFKREY